MGDTGQGELSFGRVKLEVPILHPSIDTKSKVKYTSLEFRREIWVADRNFRAITHR